MNTEKISTGGCLCGAVRYEVKGMLRDVINCHCQMCQRLFGGFGPHTKAPKNKLKITHETGFSWYQTSAVARRGFCQNCGAQLFWDPYEQSTMGIVAGTLDQPSGLSTMGHIFVSEKADFYEINDELPQFETSSNGQLPNDYK